MKAWNPTPYWSLLFALLVSSSKPLLAKPAKDHILYRIGFIHPRSGPLASYGNSLSEGVKMGLNQFRIDNPQLGNRVALIAADDRGLSSEAEKAAFRLIQQQKADILIGSLSNIANQSIAAVSSKTSIIAILPRGTEDELTAYPYVYSMSATDKRQGSMLSQFALKGLHRDRAAVLIDSRSADSEVIGKAFADAFTQGGGQVLGQWSDGPEGLRVTLSKIASAQPNVVVFPGFYQNVPWVLGEARKAGIKASFIGGDGWDHDDLFKQGEDIGGHYFFSYFHNNDPQAALQGFIREFETTFGHKPDVFAAMGYDAARVALQAFTLAKSAQTANLQKTFEGARFPSIYGAGHFGKDHVFLRPYPLMITTGGQARLMSRVLLDD